MEIQELLATFLFMLIAIFLGELARRITQPLSRLSQARKEPITYLDFVKDTLFYPRVGLYSSIAFGLVYSASYLFWLPWVLIYVLSMPTTNITQLSLLSFGYFVIHFWIILFIALTIFLPYWGFGWLSFHIWERRARANKMPYKDLIGLKEERIYHEEHFYRYRTIPWLFLLGLSLVLYGCVLLSTYLG